MRRLGVTRLYAKALSENDNSKQQIYLGGSFDVLQQLAITNLREEPGGKRANFKATLDLRWVTADGRAERANGAQLILYPDYPEVRLSGFLRGCSLAPSEYMRATPAKARRFNNGQDGRVLFFGVTDDGTTYSCLEPGDSPVSREFAASCRSNQLEQSGVLWRLPLVGAITNRQRLLDALLAIHLGGWHQGCRLKPSGEKIPYQAQNGGGYTLEALLGVRPNGRSEPDYFGYEIKGFSGYRITLMTPEPDFGFYGENGVEAFVRAYGKPSISDGKERIYFTGIHRIDETCPSSGQKLVLDGFDRKSGKIVDVRGAIKLIDADGQTSAGWTFKGLMEHWARKHAAAAYVPYESDKGSPPKYRYSSNILVGEGTAFEMYLAAMASGVVFYDPAPKVTVGKNLKTTVKARNQFRVSPKNLVALYRKLEPVPLVGERLCS